MYTDVLTGELIDPTGGGEDLKRRVLRATSKDPAVILRDDGLRIMRLARFAAELNFTPESATFEAAKAYSYLLKDISGERIQAELNKILLSDVKYPSMEREKQPRGTTPRFQGFQSYPSLERINTSFHSWSGAAGLSKRRSTTPLTCWGTP